MTKERLQGQTLANRAAERSNLLSFEVQQFGAWLLDVMSELIFVHEDPLMDLALRTLAQDAFYTGELTPDEQRTLGLWVDRNLDSLRRRDRRGSNSGPRLEGTRTMDRARYSPIYAIHVKELNEYFGLSEHFVVNGCDHGIRPAKDCCVPNCRTRRAHVAWEAIESC